MGKLGHPNCRIDRGHDMPSDLVLHLEHVADVAIVTVCPDVTVCCGLDQLGGDAQSIPGLAHASLEYVTRSERCADLSDGGLRALEAEC